MSRSKYSLPNGNVLTHVSAVRLDGEESCFFVPIYSTRNAEGKLTRVFDVNGPMIRVGIALRQGLN